MSTTRLVLQRGAADARLATVCGPDGRPATLPPGTTAVLRLRQGSASVDVPAPLDTAAAQVRLRVPSTVPSGEHQGQLRLSYPGVEEPGLVPAEGYLAVLVEEPLPAPA